MLVTQETKDKIDKLPLPLRVASNMLLDCLENIIDGKCNPDEVVNTIGTLEQNAKGKYSNEDLMNYDKACDALGYTRTNRVGLKRVLDKHDIKQVTMNGHRVGFPKSKIEALIAKLKK